MYKNVLIVAAAGLGLILPALASDRDDDIGRIQKATRVFHEIMATPAPMFVAVGGGSVGFQIGGSFTDVVMLFMNDHALQSLLGDKFKLGADATVAAGPVGRQAAAGTDVKLNAEILSYSRSKGVFAGASVSGAVVQADHSGDKAMYGSEVSHREILDGKVAVPEPASGLAAELARYPVRR